MAGEINPLDLGFFSTLASAGGLSAAARELGITTSAVSKHLAQMEERLGVPLIVRTTRRMSLTPEGETSSAGVAGWDGTETADALVARADRALYAAKHGGRDRTVLADAAGDLLAA